MNSETLFHDFDLLVLLGDYVLVEPIEEGEKVKAEIVTILYKEQIKYIQEEGMWWDDGHCPIIFPFHLLILL